MLKTKRMTRVSIVGPKSVMKGTINELHGMSLLHIKDHSRKGDDEMDIGSPLSGSDQISRTLVKLRSLESNLPKSAIKKVKNDEIDEIEKNISKIESLVVEKTEEIKTITDEENKLLALRGELEVIKSLPLKLDAFTEYDNLTHFTGYVTDMNFKAKIGKITKKCNVYTGTHGKKTLVAVFVEKGKGDDVFAALLESGFNEINTADFSGLSGTADKAIDDIDSKIRSLDDKKEKTNKELEKISEKWGSYIKSNEEHLAAESVKAEAPLRFAMSENAFIVNGWVPTEMFDMMSDKLKKAAGGNIFVKRYEDVGDAPIALDNKGPAKSFGFFMDLYSLPKYKEIDPTFFMFLAFPIFFGFMLGDWGYGLLTLIIFSVLRFKMPKMKDILNVMMIASFSTIVFGLLYDEFFGIELFHEMGIHFPHLLSRVEPEGASMLIAYALGLGVLHIFAGYLVGFINEFKMHGIKAAVLEKLSWIIFMCGFFPALLAFFNMGNYIPQYRNVLLITGIVLIIWGEGIKGALELISPLTNVLSYARLMAVGLASVILAEVVNEMTHPMFNAGIGGIIMGTVVLVLGHSINIGLGLMSPFIHSMRLHYVEFFLKFYHGGGKKYMPFGIKENS